LVLGAIAPGLNLAKSFDVDSVASSWADFGGREVTPEGSS
jgi:hypothetical protein